MLYLFSACYADGEPKRSADFPVEVFVIGKFMKLVINAQMVHSLLTVIMR